MKFLNAVLPLLTISFSLAVGVIVVLDQFNPQVGLLRGIPSFVLIILTCLLAIATAVVLYRNWRR